MTATLYTTADPELRDEIAQHVVADEAAWAAYAAARAAARAKS